MPILEDVRSRLIKNGSRQDACFQIGSCDRLEKAIDSKYLFESKDVFYIVLTHACSVVAEDFEKEPAVEYIVAHLIDRASPEYQELKNTRRLHLPCNVGGKARFAELFIYQRQFFDRKVLLSCSASEQITLTPEATKQLARWVAMRYTRAAFPDNFNNRFQSASKHFAERFKKPINHQVNSV